MRSQCYQVVIRFSLSFSCACLASSLKSTAKRLTCSKDGKRQCCPACVMQQRCARQPDFGPQMHHIPWHSTRAIGLMIVSVRLSDEIPNLPRQFEPPASPMVLCTLMGNGSGSTSPLCFRVACLRPRCAFFLFVKYLLSTLMQVQVGFNTPRTKSSQSPLMSWIGPRCVLFCQDVCHNTASNELLSASG